MHLATLILLSCGDTSKDPTPVDSTPDDDTAVETIWPDDGVVIDDVVVVDVDGRREAQAVIVVGDLIWDVMVAGQDWPEQLEVQDGSGQTLIPGLIDAHVHLAYSGALWWVGSTVEDNLRAQLAWGVTGVQDLGGPTWTLPLRDAVAEGTLLGPRIRATGPFFTAEGSHPCETAWDRELCVFVEVEDAAEIAGAFAAEWAPDSLKTAVSEVGIGTTWPRLDPAALAELATVAPVWTHAGSAADVFDATANGSRLIAHTPFDDALDGTVELDAIISTVSINAYLLDIVGGADLDTPEYGAVPDGTLGSWQWAQDNPGQLIDGIIDASDAWLTQTQENVTALVEAGQPVIAGSDAGYYYVPHGRALHRELEALVAAGLSPIEALSAATDQPAALLGWDDAGRIQADYRADFLLLSADPSEDISATQSIDAVWLAGIPYRPDDLLSQELRISESAPFCIDDRDCDEVCDLVDHVCVDACDTPMSTVNDCGEAAICLSPDQLSDGIGGACHPEVGCDLYGQDCSIWYDEACVPFDVDTAVCASAGPRQAYQTCSPTSACQAGLYCSPVSSVCYPLCDPSAADTCEIGRCNQETAAGGAPWFGLCY